MTAYSKEIIIFDLDGTLTISKSPIDKEMADLIVKLLERKKVVVMSGGGYPQFETQFVNMLPHQSINYNNLYLMPTSGTRLYTWKGSWHQEYAEDLTEKEKNRVMSALNLGLRKAGYSEPKQVFGPIIEDRGSQVTFSALGQKAPVDLKYAWDPDRKKRESIAEFVREQIPEFDVRIGGATSIDITKRGINKGYGIRKLEDYLKVPHDRMVFVGDALFYGGNDYPAKATGVDCIEVNGPEETKKYIRTWLQD